MNHPNRRIVSVGLLVAATGGLALADKPVSSRDTSTSESRMPVFSWDTLPLYVHVRKATAFDPSEIDYLAKFPLITFEKTTGSTSFGSTEAGTIKAAEAVKRVNPHAKVLFYRNVMVHYGSYRSDRQLRSITDPFLVDKKGNNEVIRGRLRAYDLSKEQVRKWWVESMASVCQRDSIDGLFLDGNVKVLTNFLKRNLPPDKKDQVVTGFDQMMRETRKALGDKLMIANILRARFEDGGLQYLDYFDGSYLEGFEHEVGGASEANYIAKGIETVQRAARSGKIIALTLNIGASALGDGLDEQPEERDDFVNIDQARVDYCIALFLVMAERHSYLCIHDGYDVNSSNRQQRASKLWLQTLPEYQRRLGPPNGPAMRTGYRYTREFEHASVVLDIESRKGSVAWK